MTSISRQLRVATVAILLLGGWTKFAGADLTPEQIGSLFSEGNEAFRKGNAQSEPTERRMQYDRAILRFEKVIQEGQIENSKLYYNLANACLLNDQMGKAILNYRRAQRLDRADTNIQKNLAFARTRRVDKVSIQTEKKVLQTLFFWHYDVPLPIRFFLMCLSFGGVCVMGTIMVLRGYTPTRAVIVALGGILLLSFLGSTLIEVTQQKQTAEGVILAEEVIARQGDGDNYPASFKDPLHAGTEFVLLEARTSWVQIRLSDGSEGWIPDQAAERI
ncbi:MAG: hypothetical protein IIC50_11650 [Planctomycetes bacterium]|nr:hypothetical protein [Planctomycetota bacterium]